MKFLCGILLSVVSLVCATSAVEAQAVRRVGSLEIDDVTNYADQLSGVAFYQNLMIVCPDEGTEFDVLKQREPDRYEKIATVNLIPDDNDEIDMEGATSDSEHAYIVGSHSIRRKKTGEESTYKKNRKRLTRVSPHSASYSLFRITLCADGQLASKDCVSLKEIIETDEILRPFSTISSKENGIDIEGIAAKNGRLYVGFRGPVLRGNYVPILSFEFDEPENHELIFVQLDGRGIRDIVSVQNGFLILAGPVGDGDTSYRLYFWNGQDCVPGEGGPGGEIVTIGELATVANVKPEGIAVTSETANEWRLVLLADGDSRASRWVASKPQRSDQ